MHSAYGHQAANDTLTFFASGARGATVNGDPIDTPAGTLRVFLDVTAASGTTPTLDVKFQTRKDAADAWRDIEPTQALTQKTAVGTQRKVISGCDRQTRCVATIGGTTPSFTFSVVAENT